MQGNWTSYHRLYDRYFYTKTGMERSAVELETEAAVSVEPPPPLRQKPQPEQEKPKSFKHNPFEKLKAENLDLF